MQEDTIASISFFQATKSHKDRFIIDNENVPDRSLKLEDIVPRGFLEWIMRG